MEDTVKIPRMETITNTAEIFNLPVHFVRAAVANGDVVAIHAGRKILVNLDSLTAFLNTGVPQGTTKAAPKSETVSRIMPISLR